MGTLTAWVGVREFVSEYAAIKTCEADPMFHGQKTLQECGLDLSSQASQAEYGHDFQLLLQRLLQII